MGKAHVPTDNIFYDLISIQYHALKGSQVCDQYRKDAEGHDDVRGFIEQIQQEDAQRASRAFQFLRQLTDEAA